MIRSSGARCAQALTAGLRLMGDVTAGPLGQHAHWRERAATSQQGAKRMPRCEPGLSAETARSAQRQRSRKCSHGLRDPQSGCSSRSRLPVILRVFVARAHGTWLAMHEGKPGDTPMKFRSLSTLFLIVAPAALAACGDVAPSDSLATDPTSESESNLAEAAQARRPPAPGPLPLVDVALREVELTASQRELLRGLAVSAQTSRDAAQRRMRSTHCTRVSNASPRAVSPQASGSLVQGPIRCQPSSLRRYSTA